MADEYKPQQGDEAELFAAYNHELVRRVAWAVSTSRENVEDATAFAWAQFLRYQPDRSRDWRAWLFRTAQRAAWALDREGREMGSLSVEQDVVGVGAGAV
jgi:DNA-directed RNA polymerase specialized sigma24 family protein